jgi:hypothetical protein
MPCPVRTISLASSGPLIVLMTLMSAPAQKANWPAPAYIAGFLLMCHVFHEHFRMKRGHRKFFHTGIGFALIVNIVIHIHLINPFIPLPPNLDPTAQFCGWRELGGKINAYIKDNPRKDGYFLLSEKGTTVAEAVFYTANRFTGIDFARPERYIFLKDMEGLRGKDAVILLHNQSEDAIRQYHPYFEAFARIGVTACIFRHEKIDASVIQLVSGKAYRGNWIPFR